MASPTPQPSLPAIVNTPLASISATNQSGTIAILAGFSLGLLLLSTGVRLYAKRYAGLLRGDDLAFYFAVIVAIVQASLVFFLVSRRLGKVVGLLTLEELERIQKGELASNLLYIVVLALSKISCALMFIWLTPYKTQKRIAWGLFGTSLIWLITSLFLEGFTCNTFPQRCAGWAARWTYIGILDILIEVGLITTSIYIVLNRQMSFQAKSTVVGAFACRTLNIVCTVLRLVFLNQVLTSQSASYWTARVQSVTQMSIAYSITACVIPYMRPLMQAFETRDGSLRRSSTEPSFRLSERSSKESIIKGRTARLFGFSRIVAGPTRLRSTAIHEHTFSAENLQDVSRLLAPQEAVLRSERPEKPSVDTVETMDWGATQESKRIMVLSSEVEILGKPAPARREVRSARSGENSHGFQAADFV